MDRISKQQLLEEILKRRRAVNRVPTVEEKVELELIRQIRQGEGDVDAAKEKFVQSQQEFVHAVARSHVTAIHTIDPLIEEGNHGLEYAIYRFDYTQNCSFKAYAVYWIRTSIQQFIALKGKEESALKGVSVGEIDIIRMRNGLGCKARRPEKIQRIYRLRSQSVDDIVEKAMDKIRHSKEELSVVNAILMGKIPPYAEKNEYIPTGKSVFVV